MMQTRCAGFSKTGASYRVPDSVAGLRPSAWTKEEGRSYLPRPSTLHGRGPDTGHRGPSPATEKRAHGVCIMHPVSCIHFLTKQ
jgi:hypothetical protein